MSTSWFRFALLLLLFANLINSLGWIEGATIASVIYFFTETKR